MSSSYDTLKMTMTPEFQARAMVYVARQDEAGAAAMERDLVALINTKNDLLAACKEAETQLQYMREVMESHGSFYPYADSECESRLNVLRAAIGRAEGGGE